MKAIVLHDYGAPDVLRFEEVATPDPKSGEILIKVNNVTIFQLNSNAFDHVPTLIQNLLKQHSELNVRDVEVNFSGVY